MRKSWGEKLISRKRFVPTVHGVPVVRTQPQLSEIVVSPWVGCRFHSPRQMIASQHRRFRQYLEEPAVQKRNLRSSFPFLFLSGFCFFTPRELCSRRMENGDLRAVFLATGKMRGRRLSITGNGVTSRWHSRIFPLTPTRLRSALHFYKCVADLV